MNWIALLPLKQGTQVKSRLAEALPLAARIRLVDGMARTVIDALHGAPSIEAVRVLSPARPVACTVDWEQDHGHGLNAELQHARDRLAHRCVLVLHGDLPLLTSDDVEALCQAAGKAGIALAPDRHRSGTNAVALMAGTAFDFAFGPDSFQRHLHRVGPGCAIVQRRGFEIDIDTPGDLDLVGGILTSPRPAFPLRDTSAPCASDGTGHAR